MKIYESVTTYIPFVYLYCTASLFGGLYHTDSIRTYQPYLIMFFLLVNTMVYFLHDTKQLVKTVVHRHVWKTVTLSIFGILINNIHTEMFIDFHFANWHVNVLVSGVYVISIFTCRYFLDDDTYMVYTHIIFLFFPLQRVWQVNLYIYVIFTTLSVILLFQRVMIRDLKDKKIHARPVIDYFMYLRIYDMFVIIGFFQLYFDYYKSRIPEIKAVEEIHRMINEDRNNMENYEEQE